MARALRYGIALTPEDRKSQGIILRLSGAENVALADLGSASTYGIVSDRRLRREAAESMGALAFDTARLGDPAGNLSGGNQQKLVIGKWLHRKPTILLLDEPTQGIDVGAKAEIYKVVSELANQGMAVILVSSEFEEIVNICDRVLVLGGGRSLGLLEARATVDQGDLRSLVSCGHCRVMGGRPKGMPRARGDSVAAVRRYGIVVALLVLLVILWRREPDFLSRHQLREHPRAMGAGRNHVGRDDLRDFGRRFRFVGRGRFRLLRRRRGCFGTGWRAR